MFKKIIVPLDGSLLSEMALHTAVPLAQESQGDIVLLQIATAHIPVVLSTPEMVAYDVHLTDYTTSEIEIPSHDYLTRIRDNMNRTFKDVNWHVRVEEGDAAGMIVDVAQEEGADLIVMSTHGRSGVGRWLLGSVTERVLRHAHCPVLAVRNNQPLQKILITLDGSELAEQSIPYGMALAKTFGATVILLQVQPNAPLLDLEAAASLDAYEYGLGQRYMQEFFADASIYLESTWHKWQPEGVTVKTAVREGNPAKVILEFARVNEIDLICMTTHGRTGLQRWTYGSVTEKVLRGSECATLIVRSPEQD